MSTSPLLSWAHALGGSICGRSISCPGPGHSRDDRSLSVTPSAAAPDGFVTHSHAGDVWQACRDFVRGKLGLPRDSWKRAPEARPTAPAWHPVQSPDDDVKRRELAAIVWKSSGSPRGALVEAYLRSRMLDLPGEAANEAIRFSAWCKFGAEWFPAMVCLVRNVVTNEPQGVHRTALALDGTAIKRDGKTFRLSLGPVTGGAIKLDPDEDVEQGFCIGEGLETCLSGRQMGYRPVWSAVSKSGVASFPVLPGIVGLTIFGERDEKEQSEKSIRACAQRWLTAGIETQAVWPLVGNDLNDEIRAPLW